MSIGSYPRVTVQGTGKANNTQNGLGLMLFNSTTQQYEAATAATFAGGGGGGDATAANQSTQITEAQTTNNNLTDINITLLDNVSGGNTLKNLLDQLILINGGVSGSKLITSGEGTVSGLTTKKIVINEDAVLSILTDTNGNDLITDYNLSGKTLKQGSVLVTKGYNINSVRVTSGTILIYGA
jgi:hypothetical protein